MRKGVVREKLESLLRVCSRVQSKGNLGGVKRQSVKHTGCKIIMLELEEEFRYPLEDSG